MRLFYNCAHPIEILESLTITSSIVCGRDRGVSMSARMLDSHGAFTFVFHEDRPWYSQFKECVYEHSNPVDHIYKPSCFKDEHEWWSQQPVNFVIDDVKRVYFRANSPGARMFPRKMPRIYKELKFKYGDLIDRLERFPI